MARQYQKQLYTLEEYERMIDEGVFHEDERIELIRGEIVEMTPIGFDHNMCVAKLNRLFNRLVGDEALVWVQSSIGVGGDSRPEPDLALLRWRDDYSRSRPIMAQDVILVIEVADTSLKYDRTTKGPLYAQAGIPEYWIVNLKDNLIEVYTSPGDGLYRQVRKVQRGETLSLPGGLNGEVQVSDILGE